MSKSYEAPTLTPTRTRHGHRDTTNIPKVGHWDTVCVCVSTFSKRKRKRKICSNTAKRCLTREVRVSRSTSRINTGTLLSRQVSVLHDECPKRVKETNKSYYEKQYINYIDISKKKTCAFLSFFIEQSKTFNSRN